MSELNFIGKDIELYQYSKYFFTIGNWDVVRIWSMNDTIIWKCKYQDEKGHYEPIGLDKDFPYTKEELERMYNEFLY